MGKAIIVWLEWAVRRSCWNSCSGDGQIGCLPTGLINSPSSLPFPSTVREGSTGALLTHLYNIDFRYLLGWVPPAPSKRNILKGKIGTTGVYPARTPNGTRVKADAYVPRSTPSSLPALTASSLSTPRAGREGVGGAGGRVRSILFSLNRTVGSATAKL